MKEILTGLVVFLTTIGIYAQDISGIWKGKVNLGNGKEITFLFNIKQMDGKLRTTISIPSNRVEGLKPKQTTFLNSELIVDGSNLGIGYKGTYDSKTETFNGKFQERANKIPLILEKDSESTTDSKKTINLGNTPRKGNIRRPQEPEKPYPYFSEDVEFYNRAADIKLAGTFTRPKKGLKFPTVVLISGSGGQDRDGTAFGHKPLLVLADYLTKQGVAVLRFDDRGFGKSTGDFSVATTADFASDVASAVRYLKNRDDVDEIGLIGHSEGGIIAPIVANSMKKSVDFIISLAGTGIIGSETSLIISKNLRPFPVQSEEAYENAIGKAIAIASKKGDIKNIKQELTTHYQNTIGSMLKPLLDSEERINEIITGLVDTRISPWSRYFYGYNPSDEFKRVKCPVLAINGTKDIQVPADVHLIAIEKALEKGKTKNFKVKRLEGLNHFFQKCITCEMSEYEKLNETFNPVALSQISNWILETIEK